MTSLQTVVMGLVIVFLDVPPDGFDWVADPLGWLLVVLGLAPLKERLPNQVGLSVTAWICLALSVVTWPPESPATLGPVIGWLFSLPTLAWCFLVCDATADATGGRLRLVLLTLRNAFVVIAVLPGLVYLADADWASVPAEVLVLTANVGLVLALWSASSRPGLLPDMPEPPPTRAERREARQERDRATDPEDTGREPRSGPEASPEVPAAPRRPRAKPVGFSAEEAKRRARERRERSAPSTGSGSTAASGTSKETGAAASRADPARRADPTQPVTGAEVIAKVRRRRAERLRAQGRQVDDDLT